MPNYRLYRLDGAGRIVSAEWLDAADDEAARQNVRDREPPVSCELWQRGRLVARVQSPGD